MRRAWVLALCVGVGAAACASPQGGPEVALWRRPADPTQPGRLAIEPRIRVARVGDAVELRLSGADRADAVCTGGDRVGEDRVSLPGVGAPGIVEVHCSARAARASAQVTYTDAAGPALAAPYAGAVVLLKLRSHPHRLRGGAGSMQTGVPSLDSDLRTLGAYAFRAFPFAQRAEDHVGLDRWIAIDIPPEINFYQAAALLRADPGVYPESFLADDAQFRRVDAGPHWPAPIAAPRSDPDPPGVPRRAPGNVQASLGTGAELSAIGAPEAWKQQDGAGVRIAVIDTGVDANHLAISPNLRSKGDPGPDDSDGNGLPGDDGGVNFAHLAIAHGAGAPWLALGVVSDLSDWHGAAQPDHPWGHGTALAAIAAGAGGSGVRQGVAPRAEILAVDVEENARAAGASPADDDPRMTVAGEPSEGLVGRARTRHVWPIAAGVAYAVAEGAQVVTCAWDPTDAHWILHDALTFAEDNCALLVCAGSGGFPANWSPRRLAGSENGSGELLDAWRGERRSDFFERPLRGMLLAGESWRDDFSLSRPVRSAVSDPGNDSTAVHDAREADFRGSEVAVGLVAGAGALIRARRPDLEPWQVRELLLATASSERLPSLPAALRAAARAPRGTCLAPEAIGRAQAEASAPLWKRVRVRVSTRPRGEPGPPASPEPVE